MDNNVEMTELKIQRSQDAVLSAFVALLQFLLSLLFFVYAQVKGHRQQEIHCKSGLFILTNSLTNSLPYKHASS